MSANITLAPLNDLSVIATLFTVNATTGVKTPLTTGTVTAFLSTSSGPTATAADPTLAVTCTYTGKAGKWLVAFSGNVLTAALLATLFTSATPYLIVQQVAAPANLRVVTTCAYDPTLYTNLG